MKTLSLYLNENELDKLIEVKKFMGERTNCGVIRRLLFKFFYDYCDKNSQEEKEKREKEKVSPIPPLKEKDQIKKQEENAMLNSACACTHACAITFGYDGDMQVHGLTDKDYQDWEQMFPAVDIRTEVARAAGWLAVNPANRKKNIKLFLYRWLTRAQERAPRVKKENNNVKTVKEMLFGEK